MPKLTVHDAKGKKVGTYTIEPSDLVSRIDKQLMHEAVVMYQANHRQGSSKTKTRSEVAGTTKKLYRQKGTGNARAGSRRAGNRRAGGHIHAIRGRDHSYSMPRKALRLASRMALASKIRDDQLVVIDKLEFGEPRTRDMASIIRSLGCANQSLLIATAAYDLNVYKSARNIDAVAVSPSAELNALNVLSAHRLLVTTEVLDQLKGGR